MYLLESSVQIKDLFSLGSFTTLAGATGIVYIICGAIQRAFNYSPKWLALAVSMVVSFIGAYIITSSLAPAVPQTASATSKGGTYLVAFLNGFLIYMSATGANQLFSSEQVIPPHQQPPTPQNIKAEPRKFTTNWWRP